MELDTPRLHVPNSTVDTDYEIQQLHSVTPPDVQQLNDIHTHTTTRQQAYDMDPLLYAHHSSVLMEKRTHWFAINCNLCLCCVVNSYAQLYNFLPLLQHTMYGV